MPSSELYLVPVTCQAIDAILTT